ncbi:multicopper oxidase domain-containing protein [Nonomuraea sp. NPDC049607]|uniref:multicopper oxidase domain-containing protein n=1 Tax=Nonomuraea sp. NPDC049607 TaxID=3154732 RepID=UPI00343FF6D3
MPVDVGIESGRPIDLPPRRARASWHLRANAVVVAWLGLTVVAAPAGEVLPAPSWLLIHVFLLGAVSTAVLIWSEHFTVALLRVRGPSGRGSLTRLALLNTATVAVLAGVAYGPWQVAAAGAALLTGVAVWHAAVLARLVRGALPGRFGHVIGWYVTAACALAAGGTLGGLMAAQTVQGALHERMSAAHSQVNVFGWVGLTVLGTLFTLWPTVLRTRMSERARRASRVGLWLAAPGLTVAVTGLLAGWRWVALAGLAAYAAGGLAVLTPLADALRRKRPHTGAAWTLGAAIVWFEVALAADLVVVATRPAHEVAAALAPLLPLVLAGFVGQVLLGSLLHLLPAVLGGGPVRFKENAALLERGRAARLVALNVGVPLLALPVPRPVTLLGWGLVLASALAFVALAATALTRARPPAVPPVVAPQPSPPADPSASAVVADEGGAGWRRTLPAVAGVVVGCLLTAGAVVVATSGGSEPVTVTATGSRTVEVTLSGMRVRPAVIEAPMGTVLTLRVTNADAQRHDLRLATGATAAPRRQEATGHTGHTTTGATPGVPAPPAEPVEPAEPAGLDLAAPMSSGWKPHDATLRPAPGGTEHHVEIRADDRLVQEVAPGVRQRVWTFNGTMPGPVLRGKVGDVFVVTFVNAATMGHGIDFHAGATAPDGPMRTIQPGERLTYRFRAEYAGAWLYHCSTMPMSQHIANGMYGAQALDLAPAQGGFAELVFPEAGTYPIVDHTMRQAEAGAHGLFKVGAPERD